LSTPGSSLPITAPAGAGVETGAGVAAAATATTTENAALTKELKERKRQMHKLQEVYGRLKEKFVAAGGAPDAFDTGRDVSGLQYEVQFIETKRAAERRRAEGLAQDLSAARLELEGLRRQCGGEMGRGGMGGAVPLGGATNTFNTGNGGACDTAITGERDRAGNGSAAEGAGGEGRDEDAVAAGKHAAPPRAAWGSENAPPTA